MIILILAIAVNGVDDTRPVLDYYKQASEGGNILETFKANQAQLREQEEVQSQLAETQRSRNSIGRISPFSFQKKRTFGNQQTVSCCTCIVEPLDQSFWPLWEEILIHCVLNMIGSSKS